MKNHKWRSSPYWPARDIWQYDCSICKSSVIGTGGVPGNDYRDGRLYVGKDSNVFVDCDEEKNRELPR